MNRYRIVLIGLLLVCLQSAAETIHIIYPEGSSSYQNIANQLQTHILTKETTNTLTISVTNSSTFAANEVEKDDLIININKTGVIEKHPELKEHTILFTFNTRYNQQVNENIKHTFIYIDQPLSVITETAKKTIKNDYKKNILIIAYDGNPLIDNDALTKNPNIKLITVKPGDIAAKLIEPELYQAGAIAAIYDPKIWSGNSARWLLQQAYKYNVPVVGYSKAFLKAGAMVSVYSSAEQIIDEIANQVLYWQQHKKLQYKISHANYNIETNSNIAKALNFSDTDIMDIGKKP